MDAHAPSRDPVSAQQLVARYVAVVEEHTIANALPASAATLPASKAEIKDAVRTLLDALVITNQLTGELTAFLEDAFVALASYVDEELAALAAEHRRASEALEMDPRQPGSRLESPNWAVVARTQPAGRRNCERERRGSVRAQRRVPGARCRPRRSSEVTSSSIHLFRCRSSLIPTRAGILR